MSPHSLNQGMLLSSFSNGAKSLIIVQKSSNTPQVIMWSSMEQRFLWNFTLLSYNGSKSQEDSFKTIQFNYF